MKNNLKISGLVTIVCLLLIFLSSATYGNPLLDVIPKNSLAVLELADAEVIQYFSEMNLPSFAPGTDAVDLKEYQDAREEAKRELGFDVLDPQFIENIFNQGTVLACVGVSIGGIPELLMALSPSDEHAFLKFVGAVMAKNELEEEVSDFKDIKIVRIILPENANSDPFDSIYYTFLEKTLVLGGNISAIRKSIDVYLGEQESLQNNTEYHEIKANTTEKIEFSTFFACLFSQEVYQVLDELIMIVEEDELLANLESTRDSLENMATVGIAGGYREESFVAYMIAPQTSDEMLDLYREIDITQLQSLQMFPNNTFFYLAGLSPFTWTEMKEDLIDKSQKATLEDNIGQLRTKTGIDIEGILSAIPSKEFSLAIFDSAGFFPKVGLLTGFHSMEKLEEHVFPLIQSFALRMGGQLMEGQYGNIPYKTLPNPMFPVAYGVFGDRLVVSTGINDIIDTYKEHRESLEKSEAINYMLSYPNVISLLYIDMVPIAQIAGRFMQMSQQTMQQTPGGTGANTGNATQEIMENLKNLKNILFWAGIEEDDIYAWLEINFQ